MLFVLIAIVPVPVPSDREADSAVHTAAVYRSGISVHAGIPWGGHDDLNQQKYSCHKILRNTRKFPAFVKKSMTMLKKTIGKVEIVAFLLHYFLMNAEKSQSLLTCVGCAICWQTAAAEKLVFSSAIW